MQGGAAQSSAVMPKQRVNLSGRDIVAESRVTSIFALHEKIPLEEVLIANLSYFFVRKCETDMKHIFSSFFACQRIVHFRFSLKET